MNKLRHIARIYDAKPVAIRVTILLCTGQHLVLRVRAIETYEQHGTISRVTWTTTDGYHEELDPTTTRQIIGVLTAYSYR